MASAEFSGFPVAAFDFYDDLEVDNTKSYWEAHKHVYLSAVREPMTALATILHREFGEKDTPPKVFRPYRDVRFAKDKTPYKTGQGAMIASGPSTGYYMQIAAPGFFVGGGFYEASGERLAAIREAMSDDIEGPNLKRVLTKLEKSGFTVGGDQLKTAPRGYPKDHPNIELLRHKQVLVRKEYGFDEVIHTAGLADRIRGDFKAVRPLISWLDRAQTSL